MAQCGGVYLCIVCGAPTGKPHRNGRPDVCPEHESTSLTTRALSLVRKAYENAGAVWESETRSGRLKFPHGPYRDLNELVTALIASAGGASDLAVKLGLISPDDAAQAIRDVYAAHPELNRDDNDWSESANRGKV